MKNKFNGLGLLNPWMHNQRMHNQRMHNQIVSLLNLSVTIRYIILTFPTCKRQSVSMTEWRVKISISLAWSKNVIESQLEHYVHFTVFTFNTFHYVKQAQQWVKQWMKAKVCTSKWFIFNVLTCESWWCMYDPLMLKPEASFVIV